MVHRSLEKYAQFSGRSRRTEFWMFALFNFIITLVLGLIESMIGGPGILSGLYSLAVFIPSLALAVRRLHDSGKSGWWILLFLIPALGALILLVFFLLDSEPGDNQYGPNPKATPPPVPA